MTQEITYFQALLNMLIGHEKINITETIKTDRNIKILIIQSTHQDYNQELWDLQNFKFIDLKIKGQAGQMIGDEHINFEPITNFVKTKNFLDSYKAFYYSVFSRRVDMIEDIGDLSEITIFKYA